jgi:thiol-disulfide isomerase/thioredoxin
MIRRLFRPVFLAFALLAVTSGGKAGPVEDLETKVSTLTAAQGVTIVHFWAPWCSNCQAELRSGGWKNFATVNPDVNIVFVTIWNDEDGRAEFKKHGLDTLQNVQLFHHPNTARAKAERMKEFLGTPVNWIPTTWVYRGGQLRYALNYGEIRFPLLQQLVRDAAAEW